MTFTIANLFIGHQLTPKRGRAGKHGHVKALSGDIKDYVIQPAIVTAAYRGDGDFTVRFDDGVKVTLPVGVLQVDWKRAA